MDPTPLVTVPLLQSHSGSGLVRMIGRATSVREAGLFIMDSHGEITVNAGTANQIINNSIQLQKDRFYEIVGSVEGGNTIKALDIRDFGDNIDMANVEGLAQAQRKYPEIFV